jgi:hypothetical protein
MLGAMGENEPRVKVIYVLGSSRGGTTRVGRTLGLLRGATYAGELRRLWGPAREPGRTCGCGKQHTTCEIWSQLIVEGATYLQPSPQEIARLQDEVAPVGHSWWGARRILRRPSRPAPTSGEGRYLQALSDLYRAFARATGSAVIVDSSKNAGDAALLARGDVVSAYVVHIVRDPRGVVHTRRTLAGVDVSRPRPWSTIRTTVYWILTHMTAGSIRRRYGPERSLLLRYEQLAQDPGGALDAISQLVQAAPPSRRPKAGEPFPVPVAHGPDGDGRFEATEIVLEPDDAWAEELHPIDRSLATVLSFPWLKRYGYRLRAERRR